MYREVLDGELARNIVGDEYNEDYTYTLISDPDKFVLSVSNDKGEIVAETELKHDYEELPEEEDEIFRTERKEYNYKADIVRSWLTFGVCALVVALAVIATLIVLKIGGVI